MEVYRATMVLVIQLDKQGDVILARFEAKGAKGNFELFGLDCSATTSVEQIEGVFDLLLLVF